MDEIKNYFFLIIFFVILALVSRRATVRLENAREQRPAAASASEVEATASAAPTVAPRGTPAPEATEALQEMLYPPSEWRARLKGRTILASDGMLHTYSESDANWYLIWMLVSGSAPGQGIHPHGAEPYWTSGDPDGADVPLSMLAFCDCDTRLRIASDAETPSAVLGLLSQDWDESVRAAAARPG